MYNLKWKILPEKNEKLVVLNEFFIINLLSDFRKIKKIQLLDFNDN